MVDVFNVGEGGSAMNPCGHVLFSTTEPVLYCIADDKGVFHKKCILSLLSNHFNAHSTGAYVFGKVQWIIFGLNALI